MKAVIKGNELEKKMIEAVNMICDAAASTIGPRGNNVLINTDNASPFITNDGVTIAKSIESDDLQINTILEIVKESSLKTNEEVGDGTTTTLVLLKDLINKGIEEIKKGTNSMILKKELNDALIKVLNEIQKLKRNPTKQDLINIASTSSNDNEIGLFVSNVFEQVHSKYSIKLEENTENKTHYEITSGYPVEIDNVPNVYFKNSKEEFCLNNVYILVLRGYLNSLETINDIINEGFERNKNIVIFSSDYNEQLNNEVILYHLESQKNIYLFKTPDYASRKITIEEDIKVISNCIVRNVDYENVNFLDAGKVKNIIIGKDKVTIINDNANVKKRIKDLKDAILLSDSDYEKDFLRERISYLSSGMATIYVGGNTRAEIREKLMRFDDALCALEIANEGVVYGEGLTYLKVSNLLGERTSGEKILKEALSLPFQKIMENAGLNGELIKKQITSSNFTKIYDFNKEKLIDINYSQIVDPLKVSLTSLKNAVSIASILLTTNYLVINENLKSLTSEL